MEEEELEVVCVSSFSGDEEDESSNSDDVSSFEEEEQEEGLREDDTSSSSSMCSFRASTSSSSNDTAVEEGPLFEMSSLMSILPIKRGLSKHYDGKSQSFASLSDVTCLEDLAKSRKKLKSSRSCPGEFPDVHRPLSVTVSSRAIAKKAPRWSSVSPSLRSPRRHRLSNSNPSVPLQRTVSPSDRPPLFSPRGSAMQ